MLYRVLAAYKTRVHDPELKATTRVWLWLIVARALVSFQHALRLELVNELLLLVVLLLAILVGTEFYQSNLRGSRLALAGVCLVALAAPAMVWGLIARMAGSGMPSGALFQVFGSMFLGGIISGCILLAIALLRGVNVEH